ncbi:MAG: hypothetical protein ACE5NG_06300 [bacterium]
MRPIYIDCVAMESEEIQIEIFPDKSYFQCQFLLRNYADTDTTFLAGFPLPYVSWDTLVTLIDRVYYRYQLYEEHKRLNELFFGSVEWDDFELYDFQNFVNGDTVQPRLYTNQTFTDSIEGIDRFSDIDHLVQRYEMHGFNVSPWDLMAWYVWPVTMKAHETIKIRHTYWVRNSFGGAADEWIRYILRTGGYWRGRRIGRVDIIAHFNGFIPHFDKNYEDMIILPEGYTYGCETIEWHLVNYEPTEDVYIHWRAYSRENQDYVEYRAAQVAQDSGNVGKAKELFDKVSRETEDPMLKTWAREKLVSLSKGLISTTQIPQSPIPHYDFRLERTSV